MNTCKENNPKNLDEAIANAANACKVICALNTRFAQHGIPMLVMSNAHKLLGEKGYQFLFLDSNDLAFLDTISMREAVQIAELAVKIRKRGNYPYPPINVILSGDTHRGVYWTNLLNELLGLKRYYAALLMAVFALAYLAIAAPKSKQARRMPQHLKV